MRAPEQAQSAGTARAVREWAEPRTEEIIELIERMVRAESPSTAPETQAPMFNLLAAELDELGFDVQALPGNRSGDHLLAWPAGEGDREGQLLLGHLDTVWPLGTVKAMPVRVEAGRLHGPGAFDMKGGLGQMIFALRGLRAVGVEPGLSTLVLITSDEEISSPESAVHVERLARAAQRAFVLEPALGPRGMLKTARKAVGRFTVEIRGKASHAGIDPDSGSSAILEATHQVQRLFALGDRGRGISVNVGTIDGGLGPNVIAPSVTAEVDVRVPTAADAEKIETRIRSLSPITPGTEIAVSGEFLRPPLEPTRRNRRLWELSRSIGRSLGLELEEGTVGGGSDGSIASRHTAVLDGLGAVGDGAHAPHEHVLIDRLAERAALLAGLLSSPAGNQTASDREDGGR